METPCYIFNKKTLENNYKNMQKNLSFCKLHYSTKANGNYSVLKILSEIGANFEVSSLEEFQTLKRLNVKPENIIFGLPVKSEALIKKLYKEECRYFIFDSLLELNKIKEHAPKAKKILRIMISDIVEGCIPFGMHPNEINKEVIANIDGLHFHITRNRSIENQLNALNRVEDILVSYSLHDIILNIGGGYCLHATEYYKIINDYLLRIKKKHDLTLLCEPGEEIIHTAGKVITTVLLVKKYNNYINVYLDFSESNGLKLRPSTVIINNFRRTDRRIYYRFFDNTCKHEERFSKILNYDIRIGDQLELSPYGAYTLCLCSDFHNFPKPNVYIESE